MKLFGSYTSPFVRHCRIVLLETGLECEFVETDQAGSAAQSPTKRVPFLQDGDVFFTDSSSIIKYLREKIGQTFCSSTQELNEFCMANTALDASVNVFFLERDGVKAGEVPYVQRQIARVESSLCELNNLTLPSHPPYNDAQLRLACYIGWSKFRNRAGFSQTEKSEYKNLEDFFEGVQEYNYFKETTPKG